MLLPRAVHQKECGLCPTGPKVSAPPCEWCCRKAANAPAEASGAVRCSFRGGRASGYAECLWILRLWERLQREFSQCQDGVRPPRRRCCCNGEQWDSHSTLNHVIAFCLAHFRQTYTTSINKSRAHKKTKHWTPVVLHGNQPVFMRQPPASKTEACVNSFVHERPESSGSPMRTARPGGPDTGSNCWQ